MPEHPGMPQPHRESISKHVWIKLTGPAAGCLSEAFCQNVAGLQENMSAKVVTPREAQKDHMTVPPTMIVMEGKAAGAQKYIKVEQLYRIVLLGDTEAGKSSLANTMFGQHMFKVNNTECQTESKSLHGRRITLINTPDFSGPGRSEEELKPEILRCITECTPGPHAFLIVLKVEKSTEQQQQAVIEKINQYFSEEVFKYAAVVFTHDGPDSDEMKIKQFIDHNKYLSDLVKKCKNRYHIINKYNGQGGSSQFKVVDLLNTVDQVVKENKGVRYTSKMLPQADNSNRANSSVTKNEMIKLEGAAAESMAKAFSGSAVVVLTPGSTNAIEKDGTETDEKEENGDGKETSETNNNEQKEMTNEEEGGGRGRKNQQTEITKEKEERKDEGEVANETKETQEGKTTGESNELEQDEGTNETQEDREEETGETVQEETQEKREGKEEDKPQKTVQEHETEKEPLGGGASAGSEAAAGVGVVALALSAAASGIGGGTSLAAASGIGERVLSAAIESVAGVTGAGANAGTAGGGGAVEAAGAGANAGTAEGGGAVEAAGAGANAGTAGGGGAVEAAGAGANAGTAAGGGAATRYVVAAAAVVTGVAGVAWLVRKIRNVIELIKQHLGVVLLVLVFYSLLLSWFFLKAPLAGTLLLSFLFLLLVIILVII